MIIIVFIFCTILLNSCGIIKSYNYQYNKSESIVYHGLPIEFDTYDEEFVVRVILPKHKQFSALGGDSTFYIEPNSVKIFNSNEELKLISIQTNNKIDISYHFKIDKKITKSKNLLMKIEYKYQDELKVFNLKRSKEYKIVTMFTHL